MNMGLFLMGLIILALMSMLKQAINRIKELSAYIHQLEDLVKEKT